MGVAVSPGRTGADMSDTTEAGLYRALLPEGDLRPDVPLRIE